MNFKDFYEESCLTEEDNQLLYQISLLIENDINNQDKEEVTDEEREGVFRRIFDKLFTNTLLSGIVEQLFYLTSGQWDKMSEANRQIITNNKEVLTILATFIQDQFKALKISIPSTAALILVRIIVNIINKKYVFDGITFDAVKELFKMVLSFMSKFEILNSIMKTAIYMVSQDKDPNLAKSHEVGTLYNFRSSLFKSARFFDKSIKKVESIKKTIAKKYDEFKNGKVIIGFDQKYKDELDRLRNEIPLLQFTEETTTVSVSGSNSQFQDTLKDFDYSKCPLCSGKVISTCRCKIGSKKCENGHEYHFIGNKVFSGNGHGEDSPTLMMTR